MEDDIQKLFKDIELRLTLEERSDLRKRILLHIRSYPMQPPRRQRAFFASVPRFAALAAAFAVIVGGLGVSAAAESALPGELLYPVKIYFNEEVRMVLARGSERGASLRLDFIERRLEEAEQLAARREFSEEARQKIEERLQRQTEELKDRVNELESHGKIEAAVDVSLRLEASLQVHENVLKALSSATAEADASAEVEEFVAKVQVARNAASSTRAEIEEKVSIQLDTQGKTASQGRLRAAEEKIAEVRRFIEKTRGRARPQAITRAEARLTDAENFVVQGKAKMERGDYKEAFQLFSKAHRVAQEAKVFLDVQSKLNVRIEISTDNGDDKGGEEMENKTERQIATKRGELKLEIEDGELELKGELARSTPCVEWFLEVESRTEGSSSIIDIDIFDRNKGVVCVQVLGTSQKISAKAQASGTVRLRMRFEGEVVFDEVIRISEERSESGASGSSSRTSISASSEGEMSVRINVVATSSTQRGSFREIFRLGRDAFFGDDDE